VRNLVWTFVEECTFDEKKARRPLPERSESPNASYTPDTQAADRSTNGVDGLLAALEDKRIEVSLHAAAKAQAAQTLKQPTPGKGDKGNPDRPTARPDKNLKDKELWDKEKREKRENDKTRQHKKPEPEVEG
jgi:hypothetical protein